MIFFYVFTYLLLKLIGVSGDDTVKVQLTSDPLKGSPQRIAPSAPLPPAAPLPHQHQHHYHHHYLTISTNAITTTAAGATTSALSVLSVLESNRSPNLISSFRI
jgi:hypothetical protein